MDKNNPQRTTIAEQLFTLFHLGKGVGWAVLLLLLCVVSCARMGQPDGGWYDEVPPRVVGASPNERGTNVKQKRIEIFFNEIIKLENPSENVVICPTQLEMPEIKTVGSKIRIDLQDSLMANTTYTIDFSDAITDNNESNPLGNYTYVFSTGDHIDTLEVAGYVLNAKDLEPVKGSLVGLYSNLADSAFQTEPMLRTGRTDSRGHFVIRGVAPGKYRIYSLEDSDGDFKLSQRSERAAFSSEIIIPTSGPDVRQDTIWRDSLHIEDIKRVPFIHYYPDDVCLRAFVPDIRDRFFIKAERNDPDRVNVYFTSGNDSLPKLRGLNFDSTDAFVVEHSEKRDTVTYWLRDTMLVNQDTLQVEMSYFMTDTLGCLVQQTDTLEFLAKTPYEKRLKKQQEELEKWEKQAEKARKKGREPEPRPSENVLEPKVTYSPTMSPDKNIWVTMPKPLARIDTAAIHLYSKIDTLWYNSPVQITSEGLPPRTYIIKGEWRPEVEYSLEIDSAAFCDIYGNVSKEMKHGIKIASNDTFSSIFVNVDHAVADSAQIVVQLLEKSGNVVAEAIAKDGTAEFYYVKPANYFVSLFIDRNSNGKWDSGDFTQALQPEEVYYHSADIECKAKWDVTVNFDGFKRKLFEQKPSSLVKQKADKKRVAKNMNAKRAKDRNIKFDPEVINRKF